MDIQPTSRARQKAPPAPASRSLAGKATVRSHPSPRTDLQALVAKRAYELHTERGYRHGHALEDWLEAEREILSQAPPV